MRELLLATIITSAVASCAFAAGASETPLFRLPESEARTRLSGMQSRRPRKAPGEAALMRPGNVKTWLPDAATNEWMLFSDYTMEYNPDGSVRTEREGDVICHYEYDDMGRCVSKTISVVSDFGFEPMEKEEYEYDSVLTDFLVLEKDYSYFDGEWSLLQSYEIEIVRNSEGNISKLEGSQTFFGIEVETGPYAYRVNISYGSDGKASEIAVEMEEDDAFEPLMTLRDIEWDRTDGQFDVFDINEEDFFLGPNRFKSARIDVQGESYPILVTVEYDKDGFDFSYRATMGGMLMATRTYARTDEYGSFEESGYLVADDDEDEQADNYTLLSECDSFGQEILRDYRLFIGREQVGTEMTTVDAVYDSSHGYPLLYTATIRRDDLDEPVNAYKIEYSGYMDVAAGVGEIAAADDGDTPVEYFNLQGMCLGSEKPAPGIYIRRQGDRISKVTVR